MFLDGPFSMFILGALFRGLFSVAVLDVSFRGLFSVVVLVASFMCLIKYLNVEIFFHNNVDKIISSYI